jgi:hypothetical protein
VIVVKTPSKLCVLQLVIINFRNSQASLLLPLAVVHSRDSNFKVFWRYKLLPCCGIFLNEKLFVSFVAVTTGSTYVWHLIFVPVFTDGFELPHP